MSEAPRVAVIGGGIAGLAAAWRLRRLASAARRPLQLTVFEAATEFGGKIRTERIGDLVIEQGPDSFVTDRPWAARLCEELGLAGDLVGPPPAARRVYLVHGRRLQPLPDGLAFGVPVKPVALLTTPLLSWRGKLRAALEPFVPRSRAGRDTTVAEFLRRRLGEEASRRLAEPLLGALYGGSPGELSVRATLSRLVELEQRYGSLTAGFRRSRGRASDRPPFLTLRGGLRRMIDALVAALAGDRLLAGVTVTRLAARAGGGYEVGLADGSRERFDAVILALPARPAAALVEMLAPEAADALARVSYSPSLLVTLGFEPEAGVRLPEGSGFLVPDGQRRVLSACTWVSSKWPHAVPAGYVLLRCFLDVDGHPDWLWAPDGDLVERVRQDLTELMGLRTQPTLIRVHRWPEALPRYVVGHLERVEAVERALADFPGIALAGAAYRGVGLPDCARQGGEAAERVAAHLGIVTGDAAAARGG